MSARQQFSPQRIRPIAPSFEGPSRLPNWPTSSRNDLLAALPQADYERLLPDLEPVILPHGTVIHATGQRVTHLYFLTTGIIARCCMTKDGRSAAFAVTGNEGVVGISAFLSNEGMASEELALTNCSALRLPVGRLRREFRHSGSLSSLLLRYTMTLIAHTGQIVACNRHHSVHQRVVSLLLSMLDRMHSDQMEITQDQMANMLGVRRESVTEAAGKLQKTGLIQYLRGQVIVLDRTLLEAQACECYAVVKRLYHRLPSTGNAESSKNPGLARRDSIQSENRNLWMHLAPRHEPTPSA